MKKIKNANDLINSVRFISLTDNKRFTKDEVEILDYFITIMVKREYKASQYIPTLAEMVKWDMNNLIERFDYLKKYPNARTKEYFNTKYGSVEGKNRWDQYVEKQRISNTFEYKKERHNWTKEQFKEYNKGRAVTLQNCIKKHGEEKGKKVWDSYIKKQSYTNTLEYYKEKYGEKGHQEWVKYNQEKGKASSISWVMKKHGVSEKEALRILADRTPNYVSNIEKDFVIDLQEVMGREIKYTCLTNQFSIWNRYLDSIKFYDIVDTERKKIVEFYGDYWHCNPKIYEPDFCIKGGMPAKEVWKRDYLKVKSALDAGFEVMIVWEIDYMTDPTRTINRTIEWMDLPKKK